MRSRSSFIRSTVSLVALAACAWPQEFRATLGGKVTDPSGSAIPRATVKAVNKANNRAAEAKSNSDGIYVIPFLDPAVYDVQVTAPGFQKMNRGDITLAVSQKLDLPIQMTVGQITQEITVTGEQMAIQTTDSNRGLVFDPIKTQDLPLNGRQSYMLLTLTPGVIFTQEQFGASGFSGTRGWDVNNSYKFNGARAGNGNNVASGWRIDYILTYISGFPVGLPNLINYCGNWANGSAQNQFHWFNNNPSCYAQFPLNAGALSYLPPRFSGNVNNPAAPQLHLALVKETAFKDRYKLTFRAESFNLTNTAIRPGPGTGFPSTTFGVLPESEQNFPRLVQLALKLYF